MRDHIVHRIGTDQVDVMTVDCLIICKVLPIVSHISFRQKNTTLAYVLEVTVTLSQFAQTSFANPLLYHEVYFLSFDFFSFTVFDLQCFILLYNICVCHLFNKEISSYLCVICASFITISLLHLGLSVS